MTHDKFCDSVTKHSYFPCTCSTIQAIRQDQSEKVAQEIELKNDDCWNASVLGTKCKVDCDCGFLLVNLHRGKAAAIARGDSK